MERFPLLLLVPNCLILTYQHLLKYPKGIFFTAAWWFIHENSKKWALSTQKRILKAEADDIVRIVK